MKKIMAVVFALCMLGSGVTFAQGQTSKASVKKEAKAKRHEHHHAVKKGAKTAKHEHHHATKVAKTKNGKHLRHHAKKTSKSSSVKKEG